jgi:hypothetical protein
MRQAEWKRLVRPLLPVGERWEFRGSLCYRAPVGRFMFGVLAEGSAFDKGVYIWRVSMPLLVSSEGGGVNLSYSERIGGGAYKYYLATPDDAAAAITSGLRDLPSEHHELLRLIDEAQRSPNIRLLELAARAHILLGDTAGARAMIAAATRRLEEPVYDWEVEVQTRAAALLATLDEEGLAATQRHIDAQTRRTAVELGLSTN